METDNCSKGTCGQFLGEWHTALTGWGSVQKMDKWFSQASGLTVK